MRRSNFRRRVWEPAMEEAGMSDWTFLVELMGLEPTTPCLQSSGVVVQ